MHTVRFGRRLTDGSGEPSGAAGGGKCLTKPAIESVNETQSRLGVSGEQGHMYCARALASRGQSRVESKQSPDQSPPLGLDARKSGARLCADRLRAQWRAPVFASQQEVNTR